MFYDFVKKLTELAKKELVDEETALFVQTMEYRAFFVRCPSCRQRMFYVRVVAHHKSGLKERLVMQGCVCEKFEPVRVNSVPFFRELVYKAVIS